MKILYLSNFYPPHQIGGYELLCLQVVAGLSQRGHEAAVLTSTYGVDCEVSEGNIHRLLRLESDLYFYQPKQALTYPAANRRNLQHLHEIANDFKPDVVFVWGMWNLSKALVAEAERLFGSQVVYYLANPWPIEPNSHQAYWDMPARSPLKQLAKQAMRAPARVMLREEWQPIMLRFEHAPCCSLGLRDQLLKAKVPLKDAPVIYEGIDLEKYVTAKAQHSFEQNKPLALVFVGNLAEHKGVHTAIEAVANLPTDKRRQVHLTILGAGHPLYEARLHSLVETHQLAEQVSFHRPIPRNELPAFLGQFDVLLLPSIWEEPLALIMQEGLATGLVVVGTATGGTKEIIVDGENGLLFAPSDAVGLSRQIDRLILDPILRHKLALAGQRTACEKFDFVRMLDDLESYLLKVHAPAVPV